MMWGYLTVWWTMTVVLGQKNALKKGGVIQENTGQDVLVMRDSVLATLVYEISEAEYMWNPFIANIENLIANVGENNCIKQVLNDCRESRFKIREFVSSHKSLNVEKRQAMLGVLGGLTSLVTFGLSSFELNKINAKIADIKFNMEHSEGTIETIKQITKYNSKQIENLKNIQVHTTEILSKLKLQLLKNIESINELKLSIVCINLKLTYINLSTIKNDIMEELGDLLKYKFNKDLMTYGVKSEICKNMIAGGL